MTGIEAIYLDARRFNVTGNLTDVFLPNRQLKADCGLDGFKFGAILSSSFADGTTNVLLTLESESITANLFQVWYESSPHMSDGRPIIRSDTRPINTQTYFTCCGDSPTGIGDGTPLRWDFSDSTADIYTGPEVPSGFKAKEILLSFNCPVYLKDGTIYFFNAPWGQVMHMDIVVPDNGYYPNPAGMIPAAALGLPGNAKYSQADGNLVYQSYVHNHFVYGDCPMGDELNAEGCAVDSLPIGWFIRGLIMTPESDNISQGYAGIEMYRCHTVILPGQTLGGLH